MRNGFPILWTAANPIVHTQQLSDCNFRFYVNASAGRPSKLAHVSSDWFSFHQFPTTQRERHDKQLFRSPITTSRLLDIYTVNIRFLLHRKNIIIKIRTASRRVSWWCPSVLIFMGIIFGALLRILRAILSTTHPSILTGLSTLYWTHMYIYRIWHHPIESLARPQRFLRQKHTWLANW